MAREQQVPKLSRRALGKLVNLSDSAVAAWESGRNVPDPRILGRVERHLHSDGLLQDIVDCLVTGEKAQEYIGRWLHVETHATTLLWFEFRLIPGLLQHEQYAHAILRDEQRVKSRLVRQKILTKQDAPVLVALIDESVLRRNVGGPAVMRAQLKYLEESKLRRTFEIFRGHALNEEESIRFIREVAQTWN